MSFRDCKIVATGADPDAYHYDERPRGHAEFIVSHGMLAEFVRCPRRWLLGYVPPPSDAKEWGSLMDTYFLARRHWENKYVVEPETYPAPPDHEKVKKKLIESGDPLPWNNNAGYCREWCKRHEGKKVISGKMNGRAHQALARLADDLDIMALLAMAQTQVWVAGVYADKQTGLAVPVKALLDIVPSLDNPVYSSCLADFKTTRSCDPRRWGKWVFDRNYHSQAAFYTDLYTAATGEDRNTWLHVCQENFPPFESGKRMLSDDFIVAGRNTYIAALQLYCRCLAESHWPGYDEGIGQPMEGWTKTEPEDWMMVAALSTRYGEIQEEEEDEETAESEEIIP